MSITTFILGESGTGKTSSLRNFDGSKVALIQVNKKPLPFKPTGWKPFHSDNSKTIISAIRKASEKFKVIIIDDFQYLMSNEFMVRSEERGFDKFTDIARHAWDVVKAATCLPDDVRIYFLSHIQTGDDGTSRIKTIGKLLDEKICLEGMVTIVLKTQVQDGEFYFKTKNSGYDTVKSPMGMFDSDTIDNDLAAVDKTICDYYEIKGEQ